MVKCQVVISKMMFIILRCERASPTERESPHEREFLWKDIPAWEGRTLPRGRAFPCEGVPTREGEIMHTCSGIHPLLDTQVTS